MGGVLRGDLGRSITYDMPISDLILSRLAVTIPLALLSILFAVVFSIPLGVYAAPTAIAPGITG